MLHGHRSVSLPSAPHHFCKAAGGTTFCEWKGTATYRDVEAGGQSLERVAW